LKVLRSGVGAITESDVLLASASNASSLALQRRTGTEAQELADQEKVDIACTRFILRLQDEIKRAMTACSNRPSRRPTRDAPMCGRPSAFRGGYDRGFQVVDGSSSAIPRCGCLRDNVVVFKGKIASLPPSG